MGSGTGEAERNTACDPQASVTERSDGAVPAESTRCAAERGGPRQKRRFRSDVGAEDTALELRPGHPPSPKAMAGQAERSKLCGIRNGALAGRVE